MVDYVEEFLVSYNSGEDTLIVAYILNVSCSGPVSKSGVQSIRTEEDECQLACKHNSHSQ
jgi:hypothetical protein